MRQLIKIAVCAALTAIAIPASAEGVDSAKLAAVIAAAFPNLTPELQKRVDQDETLAACSMHRDSPPGEIADAILAREAATIVYPADGKLMGDWKVALKESNNGYGWRVGDTPKKRIAGGNCYACHQLASDEVAYGNLGPSLSGYGKDREITDDVIRETYAKIYNAQSVLPCSQMPRMGANGFLTPEQIRDFVAMLLDPESPVNK